MAIPSEVVLRLVPRPAEALIIAPPHPDGPKARPTASIADTLLESSLVPKPFGGCCRRRFRNAKHTDQASPHSLPPHSEEVQE